MVAREGLSCGIREGPGLMATLATAREPRLRAGRALGRSLLLGLVLAGASARAQESPNFPDFPGSRPLVLPQPPGSQEADPVALPAAPLAPSPGTGARLRIQVTRIEVEGNTVLLPAALAELGRPYLGRPLGSQDLQSLQDALTRAYVNAGYANSWATLPDQDFVGGVLRVRIVEGQLSDVVITGNRGYSAAYLRERLRGPPGRPLNAFDLEGRIQVLRAEPGIRSIRATVRPGVSRDKAILYAEVREAPRLNASVDVGNLFNPTIGEMGGYVGVGVLNPVAGWGDRFGMMAGLSEGLTDLQLDYEIPVGDWGTGLEGDFRYSEASIVEPSLEALDIRTRYLAAALTLSQPVWQGSNYQIDAGLRAEWRESQSTVLGFPFAFSEAAGADGQLRDFVLRFSQSISAQTGNDAFGFRSTWNFGLNVLGATSAPSSDRADFVSWLGQAQWLRRLEGSGVELFMRANVQLALDPLLPFERFSVGGRFSVRGYRENQEVRDNGYSLGLEARIPVLRAPSGRTLLRVGPFVDSGRSWSEPREDAGSPVNLASIGVEAVWSPSPRLRFELIYGYRLLSVTEAGEKSLQDYGIEFRVVAATF